MTFRQFHRWVGTVAAILFLLVAITGVILQSQKIFGDDEATREEMANAVSPQPLEQPLTASGDALDVARAAVNDKYKDARVAAIDWHFKGQPPLIVFHLDGAEKLRVSVDAVSHQIINTEDDEESLIRRLHTGEALGDGGKILGLLWGLALIGMTVTGIWMYVQMVQGRARSSRTTGLKRWFWIVVLAILAPHAAFAGSPFLTDDPGFAAQGWEVKGEMVNPQKLRGAQVSPAPQSRTNA